MLSPQTTGTESIQITSAEAGRLKVVLPYHPDRIAKMIKGWGLIRNGIRLRMDEIQRRTSKKSLGRRSQSWQDATEVLSYTAHGILYGTR